MSIRLFGIIISYSRDDPNRAGDILYCSLCQQERQYSGAYYVGIMQVLLLAGAIAVCIVWAVFGMWSMIFAAYAFTYKLIVIGNKVVMDRSMMYNYRGMQQKGIGYYEEV